MSTDAAASGKGLRLGVVQAGSSNCDQNFTLVTHAISVSPSGVAGRAYLSMRVRVVSERGAARFSVLLATSAGDEHDLDLEWSMFVGAPGWRMVVADVSRFTGLPGALRLHLRLDHDEASQCSAGTSLRVDDIAVNFHSPSYLSPAAMPAVVKTSPDMDSEVVPSWASEGPQSVSVRFSAAVLSSVVSSLPNLLSVLLPRLRVCVLVMSARGIEASVPNPLTPGCFLQWQGMVVVSHATTGREIERVPARSPQLSVAYDRLVVKLREPLAFGKFNVSL